jgi:glycosyltransferase involved in cell wall biosynthesis
MFISIIIITLNEAENIKNVIQSVIEAAKLSSGKYMKFEILLSDGGSIDETVNIARPLVDGVIQSPKGRYNQLNYGAKEAKGDVLLFLHGDTLLPPRALLEIHHNLKQGKILGGAFKKSWLWSLNTPKSSFFSFIRSFWQDLGNWLVRLLHTFPGDNAIFVRSSVFKTLNGFAPLLICEDFDFVKRLKIYSRKNSGKLICINVNVSTSARRLERFGFFKVFRRWFLVYWMWKLGLSNLGLNQYYKSMHDLS